MSEAEPTVEQLLSEVATLRLRMAHLEALEAQHCQVEAQLRHFLEAAPDAIVIVNRDGYIQLVNAQTEQIFGYRRQNLIQQPVEILMPERYRGKHTANRADYLANLRTRPMGMGLDLFGRRRDGSEFPVDISLSPMPTQDGLLIMCTIRDMTEQRRLQGEVLKARKLESLSVLAGGIAHNFNNMLTAIAGNISLAQLYADPASEIARRLATAERACERAAKLTQQLLTFAKGGAPILQTASIAELIRESADFALQGSNTRCALSLPDGLWPVKVDPGQISQVLHNIILNAAQAMPRGGIIQIVAENCPLSPQFTQLLPPGHYVKISLTDHGPGIPTEHLPHIFDPYFTTKDSGSGLGLATAHAIVSKHRGALTVTSALEVGTTFHIYLPASAQALPKKPSVHAAPHTGKGKVLVMDDEEAIRDLLEHMLVTLGYEVVCVPHGAAALTAYQYAKAGGHPFDVVLLDLTIAGGMGGQEVLAALRQVDPQVKAIVSSGYANAPVMANFRQYGFSGVVAKPYKVAELSDVLQGVLESARQ